MPVFLSHRNSALHYSISCSCINLISSLCHIFTFLSNSRATFHFDAVTLKSFFVSFSFHGLCQLCLHQPFILFQHFIGSYIDDFPSLTFPLSCISFQCYYLIGVSSFVFALLFLIELCHYSLTLHFLITFLLTFSLYRAFIDYFHAFTAQTLLSLYSSF